MLEDECRNNYEGILAESDLGREVTVFSDSIVISYPLSKGGLCGTVYWALLDLVHIQMNFAFHGILFRGGIVVDEIYHDRNTVFGKGLINAFNLENKCAKHPRVILSHDTIVEALSETNLCNPLEEEVAYVLDLLLVDEDDHYYINYLKQFQEADEYDYRLMLERVRQLVCSELRKNSKRRIREKYKWLRRYYNLTIDELGLDEALKIPMRIRIDRG